MKKTIDKKCIIRLSKGSGVFTTIKPLIDGYKEGPLSNYGEAIKSGYAMSRLKATKLTAQLIKDADKVGITAIVVFVDDPMKGLDVDFAMGKSKKAVKKKSPFQKKAKRK